MGMFHVNVTVANSADPTRSFRKEFWVDTGALYSYLPEDELEAIGVVPFGTRDMVVADGRTDRRRIGVANFKIDGHAETVPCYVIFAPKGSFYLLGATALEAFGLDVDPSHKALKPTVSIIASAAS